MIVALSVAWLAVKAPMADGLCWYYRFVWFPFNKRYRRDAVSNALDTPPQSSNYFCVRTSAWQHPYPCRPTVPTDNKLSNAVLPMRHQVTDRPAGPTLPKRHASNSIEEVRVLGDARGGAL